jgi:cell division protein ZapE
MSPPTMASEARRFTWLVDVFYDHKVKLIATADCPAGRTCIPRARRPARFTRTASRLTEMRSREYLGLAASLLIERLFSRAGGGRARS